VSIAVSSARDVDFVAAVRAIADEVAAPHAADVDTGARFPVEAVDALRAAGALSAFVPEELGGAGVSFEAVAEACFELGRRCAASAMVFAMHQIQVVTLVRHAEPGSWHADYLARLAEEQRLIASVTSEVGTGGDLGRSVAAVEPLDDGQCRFEKQAPTVSYGEFADDLFTTLRRAPEADAGDQVIVLTHKEQATLEQTGTWDPFGMRGTCSPGFRIQAVFDPVQVLETPFSRVAAESMVPVSHILWSHVWLGIATDAFDRARAFVRAAAKRTPGEPPPTAQRLSHLLSELSMLRAEVESALEAFVAPGDDREWLSTVTAALRFNNLKIAASEQAPRVCLGAMSICGIVGYKNDTEFSIGRHMRDAMSASLMIANERIHQTNAGLLVIAKDV
jgi:acyl-CoA dehydrogenase